MLSPIFQQTFNKCIVTAEDIKINILKYSQFWLYYKDKKDYKVTLGRKEGNIG